MIHSQSMHARCFGSRRHASCSAKNLKEMRPPTTLSISGFPCAGWRFAGKPCLLTPWFWQRIRYGGKIRIGRNMGPSALGRRLFRLVKKGAVPCCLGQAAFSKLLRLIGTPGNCTLSYRTRGAPWHPLRGRQGRASRLALSAVLQETVRLAEASGVAAHMLSRTVLVHTLPKVERETNGISAFVRGGSPAKLLWHRETAALAAGLALGRTSAFLWLDHLLRWRRYRLLLSRRLAFGKCQARFLSRSLHEHPLKRWQTQYFVNKLIQRQFPQRPRREARSGLIRQLLMKLSVCKAKLGHCHLREPILGRPLQLLKQTGNQFFVRHEGHGGCRLIGYSAPSQSILEIQLRRQLCFQSWLLRNLMDDTVLVRLPRLELVCLREPLDLLDPGGALGPFKISPPAILNALIHGIQERV